MITNIRIITKLSQALRYERLSLDEIVEIGSMTIKMLAVEYDVKYSDFHTNEQEVNKYLSKFSIFDFGPEVQQKRDKHAMEMTLSILGGVFLEFLVYLVFPIVLFTPAFFIFGILIYVLLEPLRKRRLQRLEDNYIKRHIGERNNNVENFIKEVMLQDYIRNRDVQIEYGYKI